MTAQPPEAGERNSIGDDPSPDPKPPLGCGTSDGADGACSEGDDLPAGWRSTTLGEVADVVSGGTPSTKVPEFWSGDIVWVTPSEVVGSESGVIVDSQRKVTQEGLDRSSAKILPVNAVLLTSRATIGAVALAGVPLATNQGFASLVCGERLLPRFAMYWCLANTGQLMARASGTTFLEISRKKVAAIPIALPPVDEQRRIVETVEAQLSKVDRMKEAVDSGIARAAALRRSIRRPWCRSCGASATCCVTTGCPTGTTSSSSPTCCS